MIVNYYIRFIIFLGNIFISNRVCVFLKFFYYVFSVYEEMFILNFFYYNY